MPFDKILLKKIEHQIERLKFRYNFIKKFAFKNGYGNINNYNMSFCATSCLMNMENAMKKKRKKYDSLKRRVRKFVIFTDKRQSGGYSGNNADAQTIFLFAFPTRIRNCIGIWC